MKRIPSLELAFGRPETLTMESREMQVKEAIKRLKILNKPIRDSKNLFGVKKKKTELHRTAQQHPGRLWKTTKEHNCRKTLYNL